MSRRRRRQRQQDPHQKQYVPLPFGGVHNKASKLKEPIEPKEHISAKIPENVYFKQPDINDINENVVFKFKWCPLSIYLFILSQPCDEDFRIGTQRHRAKKKERIKNKIREVKKLNSYVTEEVTEHSEGPMDTVSSIPLAFHVCCFYFSAVVDVLVSFLFSVWGRVWNSIVSVPNHCLFIYFSDFHGGFKCKNHLHSSSNDWANVDTTLACKLLLMHKINILE